MNKLSVQEINSISKYSSTNSKARCLRATTFIQGVRAINILCQIVLVLCTLVVLSVSAQAQWKYNESKDELTGKVSSRHVFTLSNNRIQGTFSKDFILLIVKCDKETPILGTNHISLEGDIDCTSYSGCIATQAMRFKFDNVEKPLNTTAYLFEHRDAAYFESKKLVDLMKKALEVRIEFEPMFTKGKKVIADFSLVGFSKALKKCR